MSTIVEAISNLTDAVNKQNKLKALEMAQKAIDRLILNQLNSNITAIAENHASFIKSKGYDVVVSAEDIDEVHKLFSDELHKLTATLSMVNE
ncbi:MAG: hypothetical protein WC783_04245 [Candidatus Paceibacterota bacterium]